MFIQYKAFKFKQPTLKRIDQANVIINKYTAMGYALTLRQLYYQMVAGDIIPNNLRSYKNLGETVSNARLAGLISWSAIVDRTRNLRGVTTYDSPSQIIDECVNRFTLDFWKRVPFRIEVWVEKDALIDVIAKACNHYQVDFMSSRGYCSQTEVWSCSRRLLHYIEKEGKQVVIIH
jgi:hypothetical protein